LSATYHAVVLNANVLLLTGVLGGMKNGDDREKTVPVDDEGTLGVLRPRDPLSGEEVMDGSAPKVRGKGKAKGEWKPIGSAVGDDVVGSEAGKSKAEKGLGPELGCDEWEDTSATKPKRGGRGKGAKKTGEKKVLPLDFVEDAPSCGVGVEGKAVKKEVKGNGGEKKGVMDAGEDSLFCDEVVKDMDITSKGVGKAVNEEVGARDGKSAAQNGGAIVAVGDVPGGEPVAEGKGKSNKRVVPKKGGGAGGGFLSKDGKGGSKDVAKKDDGFPGLFDDDTVNEEEGGRGVLEREPTEKKNVKESTRPSARRVKK
jgi:hypothetical protein